MVTTEKYPAVQLPFELDPLPSEGKESTARRTSKASSDKEVEISYSRRIQSKAKPKGRFLPDSNSYLYLQLNIENLANYLNGGLFYPVNWELNAIYKENRAAYPDILTQFPNHLLLSPGLVGAFKDRDVLIEVCLTPKESQELYPLGSSFLYAGALPISRIQQLMFANEDAQKKYFATREIFDDFFFPTKLVSPKSQFLVKPSLAPTQPEPPTTAGFEFERRANLFDKVLGMFAFMKNVPLLRANHTGTISDWNSSFLTALSLINREVSPQQPASLYLFRASLTVEQNTGAENLSERQRLFQDVIAHVYSDKTFNYEWAIGILSQYPELHQFTPLFVSLINEGETNYKIVLQHLRAKALRADYNLPLILLVLLCKFSNKDRTHTDKQAARIYLAQEIGISESEASISAAILGLYYGYQSMIRDDKNLRINDSFFKSIAEDVNRIKFQIERYLDRFVIESVFQYAYKGNRNISDTFDYLKTDRDFSSFNVSAPIGYTSKSLIVLGVSILNIAQSVWTAYIDKLPRSVPLSHPVVNLLAAMNANVSREAVAKMLDELPKEHQEAALLFLNSLSRIPAK